MVNIMLDFAVALLTESVDWNTKFKNTLFKHFQRRSPHGERGLKYDNKDIAKWLIKSLSSRRAWIEMSTTNYKEYVPMSLSSRRAWIEIGFYGYKKSLRYVALLTESVDWNDLQLIQSRIDFQSLSSRRAWIEIIEQ